MEKEQKNAKRRKTKKPDVLIEIKSVRIYDILASRATYETMMELLTLGDLNNPKQSPPSRVEAASYLLELGAQAYNQQRTLYSRDGIPYITLDRWRERRRLELAGNNKTKPTLFSKVRKEKRNKIKTVPWHMKWFILYYTGHNARDLKKHGFQFGSHVDFSLLGDGPYYEKFAETYSADPDFLCSEGWDILFNMYNTYRAREEEARKRYE